MKKRMHPSYVKSLLTVAVVLFLICASAVAYAAIQGKKKVTEELDETLKYRVQKYMDVEDHTSQVRSDQYYEDYDIFVHNDSIWQEILLQSNNLANEFAAPENEEGFDAIKIDLEVSYWDVEIDENGEEGDEFERTENVPVILISDETGDQIVYWNGYTTLSFRGYYYNYINYQDAEYIGNGDAMTCLNKFSMSDSHMSAAALDILRNEEDSEGWFEDYRYCTWTFHTFINDDLTRVAETRDLPFDMSFVNPDVKDMNERASLRYLIFQDGSEALAQYRSETLRFGLLMLGVWAALTAIVAVILLIILKPSQKGASWFLFGADGTPVDPETFSDTIAENKFKAATASDKIPEDLADELLAYISQNETSMGPNGYLDQMRDLIEQRRAVPKENDDPES